MSEYQKAYQENLVAKHYFRKLVQAKSTLSRYHYSNVFNQHTSRTMHPADQFEYELKNRNLVNKLAQIQIGGTARIKQQKRERKNDRRSLELTSYRYQDPKIDQQNTKIFKKLTSIKSSISQDWKKREKQLKKYGSLSRKRKISVPNTFEDQYRSIVVKLKNNRLVSTNKLLTDRPRTKKSVKKQRTAKNVDDFDAQVEKLLL